MNSDHLTQKRCQPCEGIAKALNLQEAQRYLNDVHDWQIDQAGKMIFREYVMKNFLAAVRLIDKIAELAESENHHPDLHLAGYRKLRVELSTHALGGLSENDFILAAKINELPAELKS